MTKKEFFENFENDFFNKIGQRKNLLEKVLQHPKILSWKEKIMAADDADVELKKYLDNGIINSQRAVDRFWDSMPEFWDCR